MKKKKILALLVAVLFLFISLGLILYPVWSSWYVDFHQAELELQYQEELAEKDDSVITEAWKRAEEYNAALLPGTQNGGAFTQENQIAAAKNYGSMLNVLGNDVMGYVEIPKINVNLPIYHGTEDNTLERGLGHLVGSSLPVGGVGTHSIITGHSGMASKRIFTDLEDLEKGDVFFVKVLGETLAYKVDQMTVVLPYEVSNLYIDPEQDYVTLITCTPYAVNTHRLLVRGTRIPYEEAEVIVEQTSVEKQPISAWERGYLKGISYGLIGAVALLLVILVIKLIGRAVKKRKQKAVAVVATDTDEEKEQENTET